MINLNAHYCKKISLKRYSPNNANCVQIVIETDVGLGKPSPLDGEIEIDLYGLPTNVARALAEALTKISEMEPEDA